MPAVVYYRGASSDQGEPYNHTGQSDYEDPISAVQDVSSRESGEPPATGEQFLVQVGDEIRLLEITEAVGFVIR